MTDHPPDRRTLYAICAIATVVAAAEIAFMLSLGATLLAALGGLALVAFLVAVVSAWGWRS